MGQRNLCICDGDISYAEHLAEMLTEKKEITFAVCFCSTWEHTMAFAKKQEIDILMIEEGCPPEKREQLSARKVFVLTHEKGNSLANNETGIYKYQSIEVIFSEMVQACIESKDEDLFRLSTKKKKELLGVYSPVHRAGKTTFAIALGEELAKYGSVLYVNMEEYAGIGGHFPIEEGLNLSDVLYYARQEESNLGLRLSMLVRQFGELDYIMPCQVCMDIKAVRGEEWKELLEKIFEESIYETVILDIGESIQGLLEILELCDTIYMPTGSDSIGKSKICQYEEGIRLLGKEDLMEKTVLMIVPEDATEYVKQVIHA